MEFVDGYAENLSKVFLVDTPSISIQRPLGWSEVRARSFAIFQELESELPKLQRGEGHEVIVQKLRFGSPTREPS